MSQRSYHDIAQDVVDFLPVPEPSTRENLLERIDGWMATLRDHSDETTPDDKGFTPAEAAAAMMVANLMRLEEIGGLRISACLEAMIRAYSAP